MLFCVIETMLTRYQRLQTFTRIMLLLFACSPYCRLHHWFNRTGSNALLLLPFMNTSRRAWNVSLHDEFLPKAEKPLHLSQKVTCSMNKAWRRNQVLGCWFPEVPHRPPPPAGYLLCVSVSSVNRCSSRQRQTTVRSADGTSQQFTLL